MCAGCLKSLFIDAKQADVEVYGSSKCSWMQMFSVFYFYLSANQSAVHKVCRMLCSESWAKQAHCYKEIKEDLKRLCNHLNLFCSQHYLQLSFWNMFTTSRTASNFHPSCNSSRYFFFGFCQHQSGPVSASWTVAALVLAECVYVRFYVWGGDLD